MNKKFLSVVGLIGIPLLCVHEGSAATAISIGDCLGSNCAPVTIATGSGSVSIAGSPLGATWTVTATAIGSPPLAPTTLDSNTISLQAGSGGTAKIAVTQQGNTSPLGANLYLSSMSVNPGNASSAGFTISETTLNDPANGLYTQTAADILSSDTFTTIRADGPFINTSLADGPGPFSVTDLYTITAPAACSAAVPCSFNLTINLSSVPAPLIGHGLVALLAVGAVLYGRGLLENLKNRLHEE